jgi:hypothetical protein
MLTIQEELGLSQGVKTKKQKAFVTNEIVSLLKL